MNPPRSSPSTVSLCVEHDTPLSGDIPFDEWTSILHSGEADIIRTYHETVLQPEHLPLMGEQHGDYLETHQFSARPHLARNDWYADILEEFFTPEARTFTEDKLHGTAQDHPSQFRMYLYTPEGNIQRSTHLDARDGAEKFDDRLVF